MSKEVFNNLPKGKKEKVLAVLKQTFQAKPIQQVTVKEIVEELNIARGSFYQYFEDLEDAYFTILDREITDIHLLFMKIYMEENNHLSRTLDKYGEALVDLLFAQNTYNIYKNYFLYWDENLNQSWNNMHQEQIKLFQKEKGNFADMEKVQFVKTVIHGLIKRNYQEHWSKEKFMEMYQQHIHWIQKGVN